MWILIRHKMKNSMKRMILGCCLCFVIIITGCTVTNTDSEKIGDVEYTIIREELLPSEVVPLVKKSEKTPMKLSYTDQGNTFIIRGYGGQPTSGYSVEVLAVYETETTICVQTNLLGPKKDEEIKTVETYPYVVIQIKETSKPVVFQS